MAKTIEWCGYHWKSAMEGGRLMDRSNPYEWFSENAVWIGALGDMSLHIQTEPREIKYWDGNTYKPLYGVGLVRSKEEFGYGKFSSDIILPRGGNLWPSFWLCGVGAWPENGEIDILEAESDVDGSYYRFPLMWKTTNNVHYLKDEKHRQAGMKNISWLRQPKDPTENFIRYEVDWRPGKITFKVNGKTVRKICGDAAKLIDGKKMNVIFNIKASSENFNFESPMIIRNFKHEPHIQ